MQIRKADKNDKNQIQALMNELNLHRTNIFNPENKEFHQRINPHPPLEDKIFAENIFFVAASDDNQIVGFIQGIIDQRKNHQLSKLGYINELFVQDKYRGQGVAKNLFLELENELKQQGCDHLITHTDFENDLSQQFYSRVGMSKTTVELWKKL